MFLKKLTIQNIATVDNHLSIMYPKKETTETTE